MGWQTRSDVRSIPKAGREAPGGARDWPSGWQWAVREGGVSRGACALLWNLPRRARVKFTATWSDLCQGRPQGRFLVGGEKFMNDRPVILGSPLPWGPLLPWRRLCSVTPRTSREGRARPLSARQEIDLSHLLIPDWFCFTKPKDAQGDDDIEPVPSPMRLGCFEESKSRLCCIDGLGTDFLFLVSQNTYCHDLLVLVFCFWKSSKI